MRLELRKNTLRYQRQVARQTVYREETAESIVPDTLPDIGRIVDTTGIALIRDWESGTGEVTVRCVVQAVVLYTAEEDRRLYRLEVPITVTQRAELREAEPGSDLLCSCTLIAADAHMINPRKVAVRVNVAVTPRLYARTEETLTTGIDGDDGTCCARLAQVSYAAVTAVTSKNFTLVEDVNVPEEEGTVRSVLRADLTIRPAEVRIAGNRVTVKAEAEAEALCENTEGRVFRLSAGFGFTQTAEVPGAEEGQRAAVEFGLRSFDLDPALDMAGNSRYLSLSAGVVMNLELSRQAETTLVTDLYGTRRESALTFREAVLMDVPEEMLYKAQTTEHVEMTAGIRRVADQRLQADEAAERLPGETAASLGVMASLLCEGEDGCWYSMVRRLTLRFEAGEELPARIRTEILGFTAEPAAGGGLDLTLSAAAGAGEEKVRRIAMVEDVTWGECYPEDGYSRMSALIRRASGRETLWDIAREYHTSADAVALSNQMTPEDIPAGGTLLLIPMK